MIERITAASARQLSTSILGEEAKKQLDVCEEAINNAVKKNKFSANVNFKLESVAEKDLISRGFTVKYTDGDFRDPRESGYTTINW